MSVSRRSLLASLVAAPVVLAQSTSDWVPLFDGKTLNGWKESGGSHSFRVVDGAIAADGPRAHLFYDGPIRGHEFSNFELKVEVMTRPLCNSGVFFHTHYQADGFPAEGFEVQVNNSALGEGTYRERKKTGSLYGVSNVYKSFARDDEWFPMHVVVRGKRVQISVSGLLLVDFVEPDPPVKAEPGRGRVLGGGTFALQCHDPGSKALFRNIVVRPLADSDSDKSSPPVVDETWRELLALGAKNYPVVDYHVHLKGGLTLDNALRESRRTGIQYGIAVNCGKLFPVSDDAGAREFLNSMKRQPAFVAMQAEGREWVTMFSKETIAQFDYVFTDSMTWTDDNGRRMRTWIKEEVGEIAEPQKFMDMLVKRIEWIYDHEPVDIYANPTFLPDVIAPRYDELWTRERMERVVDALRRNGVAMELNNRYRLPSAAFVKMAKAAGVKFSFGTNNTDANLGRCEYGLQMIRECDLKWQDFFVPKPDGEKPIQTRGLPRA
ncbi:MAG: family 16 glycoside hydrolase [Bryobacteraceae bacterium]